MHKKSENNLLFPKKLNESSKTKSFDSTYLVIRIKIHLI